MAVTPDGISLILSNPRPDPSTDIRVIVQVSDLQPYQDRYFFTVSDGNAKLFSFVLFSTANMYGEIRNLDLICITEYYVWSRYLLVHKYEIVSPPKKKEVKEEPGDNLKPKQETEVETFTNREDARIVLKPNQEVAKSAAQNEAVCVYNVELTDEDGTRVEAIVFNDAATNFIDRFKVGKVYYTSKVSLKEGTYVNHKELNDGVGGKNKQQWSDEEVEALVDILQELACDQENKTMVEVRKRLVQKFPDFDKDVNPHIDSMIKYLRNKHSAISEILMQRGCRWDDVDNKINCEKHWYDDWCKDHNNAVGLWNLKFPYLYKLDSLWGTNVATQLKTKDISQACENNNDENIGVATKSDSWGDEKLEEIIDALLNVSLAEEDVGRAAELCYKDPDKAKLLFALPSPIKRSYVMSCLYPRFSQII